MYGLQKGSPLKEKIVKLNENIATKYSVVETRIDLNALREEKARLKEDLKMAKPTVKELAEMGKEIHPYYTDKEFIQQRINEINTILGAK